VGHVSPEAAEGGAIARVRDGDPIAIDLEARTLELEIEPAVLNERKWSPPARELPSRWLRRYRAFVSNASAGAVLADPEEGTT
jgi:dihydroxy-acid dehydratase